VTPPGERARELATLLLEQHESLRSHAGQCAALAGRLLAGEWVAPEFTAEVRRLRNLFLVHNQTEERMLEPFLAGSDASGPLRVDRMLEEHAAEHAAFLRGLDGSTSEVAARFADFAELLDAHMAAEERTFLSPRVIAEARLSTTLTKRA
jgi:hypothetical protein